MSISFQNSYRRLPERFFSLQAPVPVDSPHLIRVNTSLAETLGIDPDWLASDAGLDMLAGNATPDAAEPLAAVYAGHQFGNWNPQLGDGRALLLGEVVSPAGKRFDIQLKGSGPTPYSRGGDGRAPLGPVLREYVVSEAMHALGVPTTRSLAAVVNGETVMRETPQPGAVLTRVASSHIRFGTFQFFTGRQDLEAVRLLADHVIQRHYPDARDDVNPYQSLLRSVVKRTAELISHWQQLGFIHGVMNTDNMLVCGETIDYGPCAFMDSYHPDTVFSSIDATGRYAYKNQPDIAYWNLANFAQCLVPMLGEDEATAIDAARAELDKFPGDFYAHHRAGMSAKIGIGAPDDDSDALIRDLLSLMAQEESDYTQTFTRLTMGDTLPDAFEQWYDRWKIRLESEVDSESLMQQHNPVIIPRNHQVEAVIQSALAGDLKPFHALVDAVQNPFDPALARSDYAQPPNPDEVVQQTFCGT